MPHLPGHLLLSVAALAVTFGFRSLTVNRLVKRKLRLSLVLLVGCVAISALMAVYSSLPPETASELRAIQNLALAAALINVSVLVAINPLRLDRVPDRFPAILQDFIVIGLVLVASTFFSDRLLTTSAVSAVVLGFALQDTLGNAFAGLAIQSEKPFHVGHWVRVGDFEGRVEEVTWRATKLLPITRSPTRRHGSTSSSAQRTRSLPTM
jgi:small-conductance mechanosensitive channel